MEDIMNEVFFSKVMLFGEYSVIRESMALAMPYKVFEGHLSFKTETDNIDNELLALYHYLKNKDKLPLEFDLNRLSSDINRGLYFNSTIPKGYGIGSSGALCAALFSSYGNSKRYEIKTIKKFFSEMESHFHGSSSGLDPLISYLNSPILIKDGQVNSVSIPEFSKGQGGIFLLNTGKDRRTEPLVNLFLEKCKTEDFSSLCDKVLNPITDACISSFLNADVRSLYEFFRELSDFQFRHFSPMIPQNFQPLWRDGLKSEEFYLKLCGAGGGGFLMGISRNLEKAQHKLKFYGIQPVFTF
jgi:mevalonate kinase